MRSIFELARILRVLPGLICLQCSIHFGCAQAQSPSLEGHSPPSYDLSRTIRYVIGPTKILVPLRYQPSQIWRYLRDEVVVNANSPGPSLILSWPDLLDASSNLVQRCERAHDLCSNVIGIIISRPQAVPIELSDGWLGEVTCCTTNGLSLLRRVSGFSGIEFYTQNYGPSNRLDIKISVSKNIAVYGACFVLDGSHVLSKIKSLERSADVLHGAFCRLPNIPIGNELFASITLAGSNIGDWKKIISFVTEIISVVRSPELSPEHN